MSFIYGDGSEKDKKTREQVEASMEAFKKRPVYSKLTKEIIDSMSDDMLVYSVFQTLARVIEESGKEDFEAVSALNVGQRALFSVWCVDSQVHNGGFNQFYFNSSGPFAEMAVEGFKTFGAMRCATLMEKANILFSSIKGDLEKFNDGTLESFSKSYENNPLNELDREFYVLWKEENLDKRQIDYIRSHVNEFI